MKRRSCLVCLALLPLMGGTVAAGDVQPRVFFSPSERAAITAQRQFLRHGMPVPQALADTAAPPPANHAAPARVDGVSLARKGRLFAWISGRRYEDGAQLGRFRIRVTASGVLLVDSVGVSRLVRVSQPLGSVASAAETAP